MLKFVFSGQTWWNFVYLFAISSRNVSNNLHDCSWASAGWEPGGHIPPSKFCALNFARKGAYLMLSWGKKVKFSTDEFSQSCLKNNVFGGVAPPVIFYTLETLLILNCLLIIFFITFPLMALKRPLIIHFNRKWGINCTEIHLFHLCYTF